MGFLLKEALKLLCRSNQWSYAVFWKIGCQNSKILIWEECHYENCSTQLGIQEDRVHSLINRMMLNNHIIIVGEGIVGRAAFTGNRQWILSKNFTRDAHPPEVLNDVHQQFSAGMQTVAVIPVTPHGVVQLGSSFAIIEDMGFVSDVKSLILHLGGIPGALLSENYGMKDPTEKLGVPVGLGMPISVDPYGNRMVIKPSIFTNSCGEQGSSSLASRPVGQLSHSLTGDIQNNQHATTSTFQDPGLSQNLFKFHDGFGNPKFTPMMKANPWFGESIDYGDVRAEVIPPKPEPWLNQQASSSSAVNCTSGFGHSNAGQHSLRLIKRRILSSACIQNDSNKSMSASNSFNASLMRTNGGYNPVLEKVSATTPLLEVSQSSEINSHKKVIPAPFSLPSQERAADPCMIERIDDLSKVEEVSLSGVVDNLTASHLPSGNSDHINYGPDVKQVQNGMVLTEDKLDDDFFQALNTTFSHLGGFMSFNEYSHEDGNERHIFPNGKNEGTYDLPPSGDDLFDILGVEYKNKLLNGNGDNSVSNRLNENVKNTNAGSLLMNMHEFGVGSDIYSMSDVISEMGMFSEVASDHLLDAVVSRSHSTAKQSSDDNVSCKTTLTKTSSSSVPSTSSNYGQATLSDRLKSEILGFPNSLGKEGTLDTSSFLSRGSKDDKESSSQTTSVYGSQIISWVEQGSNIKRDNSVSTGYSKKPDDANKSSQKRLKPGDNPRPRPKDRQMIQDRVKELRELVPNGAKCSIDALFERTIKHMLFLQSVTKHADKLKQTGETKLICKKGGLFLKEGFEGGATWAFEVGSQSMVCPIIVEDLNPPRQFLVEMLCEDRGLFLEIADLIRGLGLTILKAVMEARDDKIWARFAVEANRDMTRMEIFMSLVDLLEQAMKGSSSGSLGNGNKTNHMMAHNGYPQAAPIPATGMPSSL